MRTLFVEQAKKNNFFKRLLKKVENKENKIIIYVDVNRCSLRKMEKIVKKINEILSIKKCKQIAVETRLKENDKFIKMLQGNNINICNSRWLFKRVTDKIINNFFEENKEESELFLCINEIDSIAEKFIYKFAKEFKNLNIITNHIGKFKNIEELLYKQDGILINVTNNKRKSLAKAKIILNIDFPKEIINQFVIYDKALIISWEEDIKILKKRFEGRIIDNYSFNFRNNKIINDFIISNSLENYDIEDLFQVIGYIPDKI